MMILSILLKASLVVLAAAGLERALARRVSAAARHLIWTLAIAASLLLPVFSLSLPQWTAITWTAPAASIASLPLPSSVDSGVSQPEGVSRAAAATRSAVPEQPRVLPVSLTSILLGIYAAGVALLLLRMLAERLTLRRLARGAGRIADPVWIALLDECAATLRLRREVQLMRSSEPIMPMACGIWRSSVLLPVDADGWSADRRRAVLLHELAHVARFDCLTQTMAALASALYWPHPGMWWAARRLRVERELACDDCVLASGADARDYAGHLLELAYSLGRGRTPALAVAMAGSRQLEGRMLAVLDAARHRAAPALRGRLAALGIMLAAVIPVAVATVRAVPDPGSASPASASASAEAATDADAQIDPIEETGPGTWELRPARSAGVVYLSLSHGRGRHGNTAAVSDLTGLTIETLAAGGPIRFRRRHDAGTFEFEGVARNGVAAGTYTFAPDAAFPDQMAKRGLARPTEAQQQVLARQGIGFAFLDQVTAGAEATLERLIRAAQQGVDLDFVRGLREAGYTSLSLDELMRLRNHGVDPDYIRELTELGYKSLSLDELVNLRNHGVDPDYIRELGELGHKSLSLKELVNLRNHGVDPDYIRELAEVGHKSLSLENLINLRNHGVDPDYIRELAEAGHKSLSLENLINLRNHGVDPDYIRELAELGHKSLSLENLVNLRNHGVDPDYVRELAEAGYKSLSLAQLVDLRNHGVDADYVRAMSRLTDQQLSIERLIDLRSRGIDPDEIRELRLLVK